MGTALKEYLVLLSDKREISFSADSMSEHGDELDLNKEYVFRRGGEEIGRVRYSEVVAWKVDSPPQEQD